MASVYANLDMCYTPTYVRHEYGDCLAASNAVVVEKSPHGHRPFPPM